MRKLFFYLLKIYSTTEKNRLEILSVLEDNVSNDYSEQIVFGNVYNSYIEFIIANKTIQKKVKDKRNLSMIEKGLSNAFKKAIEYIEEEKLYNNDK